MTEHVPVVSESEPETDFADLPEPVRARIVADVAAALPAMALLPPSLRRIRDFAPARRARVGATAIGVALGDAEFRASVALVTTDDGSAASDPAGQAARAWLVRGDGWVERLDRALAAVAGRSDGAGAESARTTRLTERVESVERTLKETRTRHRGELDDLKAENARLRRALGDERREAKKERAGTQADVAEAEAGRAAAERLAVSREREVRQLTARLARLEAEAGSDRRTSKVERDAATVRARLLLDTVLDAASGLRRELGLPPATTRPAELIEGALARDAGSESPSGGRLGPDSAASLEHHLSMPRARLVIDGYNVTKSAWPTLPLESQRIRLLNALAPLVARTGAETTVVFDAHQVGSRPMVPAPRGVRVVFSPEGVIADDIIRDLVAVEPVGRVVVVVTDDAELVDDVRRDGARGCAARSLLGLLGS